MAARRTMIAGTDSSAADGPWGCSTTKALGVKGTLIKAAEQGYITQLACKMPECFCPEELGGACYFERPPRRGQRHRGAPPPQSHRLLHRCDLAERQRA